MPPKTIPFKSALSFQSRTIAHFYSKIEQQKQLLQQIQLVLPDGLKHHAQHCVISNKKLLIYTDSAAWASQIRFYNKAILAAIAPITRENVEFMQIKLLSTQAVGDGTKTKRTANLPSLDKINIIRNQGLSTSDEKLKHALLKLSATLERLSEQN